MWKMCEKFSWVDMEKHVEKIVSSELACEKLKRNIFEEKNILERKSTSTWQEVQIYTACLSEDRYISSRKSQQCNINFSSMSFRFENNLIQNVMSWAYL